MSSWKNQRLALTLGKVSVEVGASVDTFDSHYLVSHMTETELDFWVALFFPVSGSMGKSCVQPLREDEMSAGLTCAIKTPGQRCICGSFIFVPNLQGSCKTRRHSLQVSV